MLCYSKYEQDRILLTLKNIRLIILAFQSRRGLVGGVGPRVDRGPRVHLLLAAAERVDVSGVRGQTGGHARRGPVLQGHRGARRQGHVHGADGHQGAREGGQGRRVRQKVQHQLVSSVFSSR